MYLYFDYLPRSDNGGTSLLVRISKLIIIDGLNRAAIRAHIYKCTLKSSAEQ
jgi:hypothetical protein